MKNRQTVLLMLVMVCFPAWLFGGMGFMLDVGMDIDHTHNVKTDHYRAKGGVSTGLEFYFLDIEEVDFGIGFSNNTAQIDGPGGWSTVGFTPLFFSMHVQLMEDTMAVPYINARIGYIMGMTADSDYDAGGDVSGGLYYSYGFGAMFPEVGRKMDMENRLSFKVEIRYSHFDGRIKNIPGSSDGNIEHAQWTLGIGCGFKL